MKIRYFTSLCMFVGLAVVLAGCFDDEPPMVDDTPTLGFADEGAESVTDGESSHPVEVQLIAPQQPEDVQAAFEVDDEETTAQEGTHYSFDGEASDGTVTVPAGESHGEIDVNIDYDNLEPGESEVLVLELTEGLSESVEIAENFRTHEITIEALSAAVETDSDALDFGEVDAEGLISAGEDSTQTLTITNNGSRASTVDGFALDGEGEAQFDYDAEEEYELDPGDETEIEVTFAPQEEGEFEAELVFTWDMGPEEPEGEEGAVELTGATSGADDGEDDDE